MEKYVCMICGYVYEPEQGDPDNGVAPGTKRQLTQLCLDRRNHPRMAEADLMDVVPMEIQVTTTLDVFDPRSFAAFQGVETWRR